MFYLEFLWTCKIKPCHWSHTFLFDNWLSLAKKQHSRFLSRHKMEIVKDWLYGNLEGMVWKQFKYIIRSSITLYLLSYYFINPIYVAINILSKFYIAYKEYVQRKHWDRNLIRSDMTNKHKISPDVFLLYM